MHAASALVVVAFGIAAASSVSACRRPVKTGTAQAAEARAESAPAYSALGAGHLLRAVSEDGRYVTLEDGSRWDVFPPDRFKSADWEPLASMTVRLARGIDGFNYELVNTTDDEGVLARLLPRN